MATLKTVDDYNARAAAGYFCTPPLIWGESQAAMTGSCITTTSGTICRIGDCAALPSLPTGVTAWIPTKISIFTSTAAVGVLTAKVVNLGTFDIGAANTGVFTDGSAMPTQTILGTASQSLSSAVIAEVTTALTGTQTAITVTYKNQAGTGAQASPTFTPTTAAVARSCGSVPLASGDWGVQDITAVARSSSAGPTGVIKFWGIIPLSFVTVPIAGMYMLDNLITSAVNANRLGAGDQIQVFVFGSVTAKMVSGQINFVGDN